MDPYGEDDPPISTGIRVINVLIFQKKLDDSSE
jgi:hypothetical protein